MSVDSLFIVHNDYESLRIMSQVRFIVGTDLLKIFFFFQGKFQAFYQYAKSFNSDDFDYEELKNSDYVFMRWKVWYILCLKPYTLPYKSSGSVNWFEKNEYCYLANIIKY